MQTYCQDEHCLVPFRNEGSSLPMVFTSWMDRCEKCLCVWQLIPIDELLEQR